MLISMRVALAAWATGRNLADVIYLRKAWHICTLQRTFCTTIQVKNACRAGSVSIVLVQWGHSNEIQLGRQEGIRVERRNEVVDQG